MQKVYETASSPPPPLLTSKSAEMPLLISKSAEMPQPMTNGHAKMEEDEGIQSDPDDQKLIAENVTDMEMKEVAITSA